MARLQQDGDCAVWTGTRTRDGYGHIRVGPRMIYTHRLAWEIANGPIPEGKFIDHVCWNRACANTEHLRLVTKAENNRSRGPLDANNTSGYRGVYWRKDRNCWVAAVRTGGKLRRRAGFATPEEASIVAQEMRDEMFGEYAGAKSVGPTAVRNHRENMENR